MSFRYVYMYILPLWYILLPCLGQSINQSITQMADTLAGYDRRHRPVVDQSKPIFVNVTFDIVAIQDFNAVQGTFSVVGIVNMVWYDEKLQWNPALYGGIISQTYNSEDIWYPNLILGNPYDKVKTLGDDWMIVRVYSDGLAIFSPGDVFAATCDVDVTYYPYDTQTCFLTFMPWGFFPGEISLVSTIDYVLTTHYSENGEWDLTETSAVYTGLVSTDSVDFTFKIKRKPLFLLINVILPIILMLMINIMVFVLPTESGERVSFSVTVLLALAVFLTMVGDNLPKTTSLLCYFLMVCLILSTLMCVCAIINLRIYHKDDDVPVPACIAALTRALKCVKVKANCKLRNKKNKIEILDTASNTKHPITDFISDDDKNSDDDYNADEKAVSWKDVSSTADTICITVFFLTIAITVSVYMTMLVNNTQY